MLLKLHATDPVSHTTVSSCYLSNCFAGCRPYFATIQQGLSDTGAEDVPVFL